MDPDYVKVLTNDTKLLGGFQDYEEKINSSAYLNFEGRTDLLPIYIALKGSPPYGCLPINYQTFLTDAPNLTVKGKRKNDKRLMWELQISTLGYLNYNVTFKKAPFMPLPLCAEKFRDKDQFWESSLTGAPKWLKCGFPQAAAKHVPVGTHMEVWDFSIVSGNYDYTKYLKNNSDKFNKYIPPGLGQKVQRWFSPGYVEPIWVSRDPKTNAIISHHELFRLAASANMILQKRPKRKNSVPLATRACVAYPFALLMGYTSQINITHVENSYKIHCVACRVTNCIDSSLDKHIAVMILVKIPAYVMLPVDL